MLKHEQTLDAAELVRAAVRAEQRRINDAETYPMATNPRQSARWHERQRGRRLQALAATLPDAAAGGGRAADGRTPTQTLGEEVMSEQPSTTSGGFPPHPPVGPTWSSTEPPTPMAPVKVPLDSRKPR